MHMFNVSTLYRQSIKMFHQSCGRSLSAYVWTLIAFRHKPYIKSHLELQREITLKELAPSPYFFVKSICLVDMNMFARFDEIPVMTLQIIKETKHGSDNIKTVYHPQNLLVV